MAHPRYVTSRAIRQVTLPGLLHKAQAWSEREMARARSCPPWRSAFDLKAVGLKAVGRDGLQVLLLGSAVDILEEARAMRHCADMYVERCERGSYFLLSVRRQSTGKRLATVGVCWENGRLQLHQVAGFANALVPREDTAFAEKAVACMRRQAGSAEPAQDCEPGWTKPPPVSRATLPSPSEHPPTATPTGTAVLAATQLNRINDVTGSIADDQPTESSPSPSEADSAWDIVYEGSGSVTGNSWYEKVRHLGGEQWLLWLHDDPVFAASEVVDSEPEEYSSIDLAEWAIDTDCTDENKDYPRVNTLLEIAQSVGALECAAFLQEFISRKAAAA